MTTRVLIIGGYGNFGRFIAHRLSKESDIKIIIAGRSPEKAKAFADTLNAEWAVLDITNGLDQNLTQINPNIVIHTSGPFQGQGYDVAEACIRHQCHYIDLADGRDFVCNIGKLDQAAKDAGVAVIAGASSVPCLTSAIIDHYRKEFQTIDSIDYAISTAQRTNPGIATTTAILGYAGKPFTTKIKGDKAKIYGWQGLTAHKYPGLGWRLLGNCDVPDLGLFPDRYHDIKTIRFRAGLEVPFLHLGLWGLSWLIRLHLIKNLRLMAPALFRIAPFFNIFGSDRSSFHMEIKGIGLNGKKKTSTLYILTGSGHGPNIPCIPSILLTLDLARGLFTRTEAMPCVGLVDLDRYVAAMSEYDIKTTIWEQGLDHSINHINKEF